MRRPFVQPRNQSVETTRPNLPIIPITTSNENLSADFLSLADAYLALFDGITENDARLWTEGIDQTPAENLASMIVWYNVPLT